MKELLIWIRDICFFWDSERYKEFGEEYFNDSFKYTFGGVISPFFIFIIMSILYFFKNEFNIIISNNNKPFFQILGTIIMVLIYSKLYFGPIFRFLEKIEKNKKNNFGKWKNGLFAFGIFFIQVLLFSFAFYLFFLK